MITIRDDMYIQDQDPRKFSTEVGNYFKLTAQEAICHSFSYDNIAACICWHLNNGHVSFEELIDAIYNGKDDDKRDEAICLIQKMKMSSESYSFAHLANELLRNLNNAIPNLRIGNRKWNASVGNCYDPISWVFVQNGKVICSNSEKNLGELTKDYSSYNAYPNGFYLTDKNDGKRISMLKKIETYPEKELSIYTAAYQGKPFIYSSLNKFEFIPTEKAENFHTDIWYIDGSNWESFQMF